MCARYQAAKEDAIPQRKVGTLTPVLLLMILAGAGRSPAQTRLFYSGFERDVSVQNYTITGKDDSAGYDWNTDLGRVDFIRDNAPQSELIQGTAHLRILTEPHPVTGAVDNRILNIYLPVQSAYTEHKLRAQWSLHIDEPEANRLAFATRYLVKVSSTISRHIDKFYNLYEISEDQHADPDLAYGWSVKISERNEALYFDVHCRNRNHISQIFWDEHSTVPIPLDEWFWLEVYMQRHTSDGRFYVAVQPVGGKKQVVCDKTPIRTTSAPGTRLARVTCFKYYMNSIYKDTEMNIFYDDFELWDGMPSKTPVTLTDME